ncbi:MAG: hypothetical protein IJI53_12040 [Clostridia bacterium]|nr:hypothetical protein [Clostridia bacterium]
MNGFDGIVIDRLWAGHSSFWIIPGTEGKFNAHPDCRRGDRRLPCIAHFLKPAIFGLTRSGTHVKILMLEITNPCCSLRILPKGQHIL